MPNNYSPIPFWGEQEPIDFDLNLDTEVEFSWRNPLGDIPSEKQTKQATLIEQVERVLGRGAVTLESSTSPRPTAEHALPVKASF